MNDDRIEGTSRRTAGDAEEALGRHAANDRLETKGIAEQKLGSVQDGYSRARTKVREMLDSAPEIAREAIATGRVYYRRGADAVTRNATDNTALTLLVAGVAVAAVSWLVLGPRRGKDSE